VLVLLGIDSMFGFLESMVDSVEEEYREQGLVVCGVEVPFEKIKPGAVFVIALTMPLFCSYAGIYYLQFFDRFVPSIGLPFGALLELYVFVYLFPLAKLEEEVLFHTGRKTPAFIRWALNSRFMVVVLVMVLVLGLTRQVMWIEDYPFLLYVMGWVLSFYPIVMAFGYYFKHRT
jgi:SNF family Na+-dependent transporter